MSSIRAVEPADLDRLVVLEFELFGTAAWSPRSLEAEFAALGDSCVIVVAEGGEPAEENTVVGYAIGSYVGGVGDVRRIAVIPEHRRRGLAAALLRELLDEADRRTCDRVLLEVAADNAPAIALYAADGFEEIDRRPRYYPGDVDALVMMRPGRPPRAE